MKVILATSLFAFSFAAHAERAWNRTMDCASIDYEAFEQIEVNIDSDISRLPFAYQATVLVYAGETLLRNEVLPVTIEDRGSGGNVDVTFVGEGLLLKHRIADDTATGVPTSTATARVNLADGRIIDQRMNCR